MEGIDRLRQRLTSRLRRPNRLDREQNRKVGIFTDDVSRIGCELPGQADPGQLRSKTPRRLALTECKSRPEALPEATSPPVLQAPGFVGGAETRGAIDRGRPVRAHLLVRGRLKNACSSEVSRTGGSECQVA